MDPDLDLLDSTEISESAIAEFYYRPPPHHPGMIGVLAFAIGAALLALLQACSTPVGDSGCGDPLVKFVTSDVVPPEVVAGEAVLDARTAGTQCEDGFTVTASVNVHGEIARLAVSEVGDDLYEVRVPVVEGSEANWCDAAPITVWLIDGWGEEADVDTFYFPFVANP